MIYCVIPRELAGELYDKMVEYYKDNPNVTVIVDRRGGRDRRSGKSSKGFEEQRRVRDRRRARVPGTVPPWNFPIAIPSWKLIPALVCGTTVVLKPATDTPLLAERFVELMVEAGIPPGVVNIVHGGGRSV